jgi:hypothetical protein
MNAQTIETKYFTKKTARRHLTLNIASIWSTAVPQNKQE